MITEEQYYQAEKIVQQYLLEKKLIMFGLNTKIPGQNVKQDNKITLPEPNKSIN